MKKTTSPVIFLLLLSCGETGSEKQDVQVSSPLPIHTYYKTVSEIPAPPGFKRLQYPAGTFQSWLQKLPLKEDKTVYLYNGTIKANQQAQFAVVDMSRSKSDLQQCADVVMRLRAEYLFSQKKFDSVRFMDYSGKWYNWKGKDDRKRFDLYLQEVFGWCGSASLEKQLHPVQDFERIETGDVLVKGGFPGHAVIVVDMAIDEKGNKVFMLLQGYQPAQDMHLLKNPADESLSPWYSLPGREEIHTPEWKFFKNQLRRW